MRKSIINRSFRLLSVATALLFVSCDSLLDRAYDSTLTEDLVVNNRVYSEALQLETYNYGPRYNWSFHCVDDALLACATDDAVASNTQSGIMSMVNGAWSPNVVVDDQWSRLWTGVRKCNLFLSMADDCMISNEELLDSDGLPMEGDHLKDRLVAETYFNKAFIYFDLARRFKDVPMIDTVLNVDDDLDLPRVSFDVLIDSVVVWCDRAAETLPDTYSDNNIGRANKGAAMMLKSRALLYAASPLYNSDGDVAKWEAAAEATKDFIDHNAETAVYSLVEFEDNFMTQFADEVIFACMYSDRNDVEMADFPSGYTNGSGSTNPTQNLVDAFEILDGGEYVEFDPDNADHVSRMYSSDRDPRFAATILYNGVSFSGSTVDTYVNGKDGINLRNGFTRTGYYSKKFIDPDVNLTTGTTRRTGWVHFRYSEALLNYAEAMAECGELTVALEYLNELRTFRMGSDAELSTMNQEELIEKIRKERRVEFAFEEFRFWDVRRWGIADEVFNSKLYGMQLADSSSTPSNGGERVEVYTMIFTTPMYFCPISETSAKKAPVTGQTPGW